jgi:Amt family ammonium transporter
MHLRRLIRLLWLFPVVSASTALAQTSAPSGISNADNAWMLTSSALVLMMTGPGLALFYGGLVRRKNVLATMMQSFAMMCIISVLWAVIGYSLAFGPGGTFIGGFHFAFLRNVGLAPDPDYGATIPAQTYMIYQLMFAIITPALICGAFAERMKFSAMCLFLTLWALVVYSPMAHMVWGKGGLLNAALGGKIPCLDFAGGTVVHVTSGVSALICALYLGKRVGYPREPSPPHSVVLSFIGACMLWVGWFGFNAGSAVNAGTLATSAFVNTHFATAAAAIGWSVAEWIRNGKPSALGAISGAVAGLVAITPASGFVQPMSALIIGVSSPASFCFLMVTTVKSLVRLRRFPRRVRRARCRRHRRRHPYRRLRLERHQSNLWPRQTDRRNRGQLASGAQSVHRRRHRLGALHRRHASSCSRSSTWSIGLRVTRDDEIEGLDVTQHGEEGYDFGS